MQDLDELASATVNLIAGAKNIKQNRKKGHYVVILMESLNTSNNFLLLYAGMPTTPLPIWGVVTFYKVLSHLINHGDLVVHVHIYVVRVHKKKIDFPSGQNLLYYQDSRTILRI